MVTAINKLNNFLRFILQLLLIKYLVLVHLYVQRPYPQRVQASFTENRLRCRFLPSIYFYNRIGYEKQGKDNDRPRDRPAQEIQEVPLRRSKAAAEIVLKDWAKDEPQHHRRQRESQFGDD
jgi:hypothetical protein